MLHQAGHAHFSHTVAPRFIVISWCVIIMPKPPHHLSIGNTHNITVYHQTKPLVKPCDMARGWFLMHGRSQYKFWFLQVSGARVKLKFVDIGVWNLFSFKFCFTWGMDLDPDITALLPMTLVLVFTLEVQLGSTHLILPRVCPYW